MGCQSVYATGLVSRDEWAVVSNSQIHDLLLKGFESRGQQLPYWQWPQWAPWRTSQAVCRFDGLSKVHSLASVVNVDYLAIDQVTEGLATQTQQVPAGRVRVNSAGRPIHSDGKFMSYAQARKRGWGQASPAVNPWNEHQKSMAGQGHSRAEIQKAYPSSHAATKGAKPRQEHKKNAWNEHQKSMGGQGYSQAGIRQAYTPGSSGSHAPHPSISSKLNAWNEHQKSMGGQGYSRAEIRAAYHPTTSFASPSFGRGSSSSGGLGWNAFQSSMAGQGLSKAEMSAAYWAQK